MADKNIGSLPSAASFDDSSKLIAEQQGEAVQVEGALLRKFAEEAGKKAASTIANGGTSFITDDTLTLKNGVLGVNTAKEVGASTLPVTAAAVDTVVGNIEVLLGTI